MLQYEYVLGMDCGTTNIKAVALRNDGVVAARASVPSRFLSPGRGMQEQSAWEWWENACAIFRSIAHQLGPEGVARIRGIWVSSHTVSLLPLDRQGRPLRNAMTYQDGRSSEELAEILARVGRVRYVRIVGGQPSVAFLSGKLLWFRRHEPELYDKTAYFVQASSYVNFRLTGVFSCDMDQALRTQCMDVSTQEWSKEIAEAVGSDVLQKFPKVYKIEETIGVVTPKAADETGLVPGIPVFAGCSDAMAAMQATGMSRLGEVGESSGTTSLVFVGSSVQSKPDAPVATRPGPSREIPYLFDAPIQSSGAVLKWFIEKLAYEEREYAERHGIDIYDLLGELALKSPPGANGLFFFPYLLGERAPLWNDYCSGMFIGLRMDTERCDIIRAIFEGTAYALRHVIETVRAEGDGAGAELLRICGGGARNTVWNKIKASMLRMPVHVLSRDSGDVPVGDALLAGHATGLFPDLHAAVEATVQVEEVIAPDEKWSAVYDKLFPYYLSLYRSLDPELMKLQRTLEEVKNVNVFHENFLC